MYILCMFIWSVENLRAKTNFSYIIYLAALGLSCSTGDLSCGMGNLVLPCPGIEPRAPYIGASLVAQTVKNLPAMQETWVQSLGDEDPLEKEMAYQLQYSCLENSIEGGAYQATVHGVTKSQIQLSN